MEDLSLTAFWLALIATAAASVFYWTHLLGVRLVRRRLTTDAGEGPLVASVERSDAGGGWAEPLGRLGTLSAWAAAALLVVSLVARRRAAGYAPWSNMWEFTVAFAAAIALFYVVFELVYNQGGGRPSARALGALVQPVVLALLAGSAGFFPSQTRPPAPAQGARPGRDRLPLGDGGFPAAGAGRRPGRVLGEQRLGPLLGLGPQGDLRPRHLADLWRVPAHARPARLVRHALGRW